MYEYLDRRYALAYYELAEEKNKVSQYISELKDVAELLRTNSDLNTVINNPQISTFKKKELITSIFSSKVNEELISFMNILISKKRIHTLEGILSEIEKIDLEKRNTVVAHVKTVIPLNVSEREALIEKLKAKYNKNILLEEELDASIIGGVYVKIQDEIIDGTIKNKLSQMKKMMLKQKLEVIKE